MKKLLIYITIFSILLMPVFSFAQNEIESTNEGLVPCGTETKHYKEGETITPAVTKEEYGFEGRSTTSTVVVTPAVIATSEVTLVTNPCGFDDVIKLVNNIITFILFYLAIPICAIMFAYAGFLLVTAGGEAAGARTKAKTIFFNTAIGLILAVAAWLIVKTILSILGFTGTGMFFN